MAILKSDRERRILGDRILSNRGEFEAIHTLLGDILDRFAIAHRQLGSAIDARHTEENQDQIAREARAEITHKANKLYAWAFNQMNALAMPDWSDEVEVDLVDSVRQGLFPLGAPSELRSPQMVVDALGRFVVSQAEQSAVDFPVPFIERCVAVLGELNDAIGAVSLDGRETKASIDTVVKERVQWDLIFDALRDVSAGLLRLDGKEDQMIQLFRALPSSNKSGNTEG